MAQKLELGSRMMLGFLFTIFGVNGLMMIFTGSGFIPMPPPNPDMGAFMGALFKAGYLMPLVKLLEVIAGVMLITGKFEKLAIVLLAPILVNIVGSHLILDPAGLTIGLILSVATLILIKKHWSTFQQLITVD